MGKAEALPLSGESNVFLGELDDWRRELTFFQNVKNRLCDNERYCGKFVAIKNQAIIDVDENKFHLAKRMNHQFADEVVFIGKVELEPQAVEIPSPEVEP